MKGDRRRRKKRYPDAAEPELMTKEIQKTTEAGLAKIKLIEPVLLEEHLKDMKENEQDYAAASDLLEEKVMFRPEGDGKYESLLPLKRVGTKLVSESGYLTGNEGALQYRKSHRYKRVGIVEIDPIDFLSSIRTWTEMPNAVNMLSRMEENRRRYSRLSELDAPDILLHSVRNDFASLVRKDIHYVRDQEKKRGKQSIKLCEPIRIVSTWPPETRLLNVIFDKCDTEFDAIPATEILLRVLIHVQKTQQISAFYDIFNILENIDNENRALRLLLKADTISAKKEIQTKRRLIAIWITVLLNKEWLSPTVATLNGKPTSMSDCGLTILNGKVKDAVPDFTEMKANTEE